MSVAPQTGTHPGSSKDFGFLPIPRHLRHDPDKPPHFGLLLNVLFGFAATFVVANLYYCQPLLIQISETFDVDYGRVSNIPTLMQGGYAAGLLLISPLGDLIRRRPLMLLLILISSSLTIGLAVTKSLAGFEALCFLVGIVSVIPQILIPLAADLAPPRQRAFAISVVMSGLLLGVLIARVLAGIIANFASWRVVYYMATGVQYAVLVALLFFLPDYPAKNPHLTYFGILRTMTKYAFTEPILIQACIINLCGSACFSNFWVTLTFLLGGPPYHYSTLDIGLFGLVGIAGVATTPFIGRVIDRLVPWHGSFLAIIALIVFQSVQTAAGGINVAAVVIACFGIDAFRQMNQVSLTTAVYTIDASARARLNSVLLLSFFVGQIMGTSAGSRVFVQYGWRASAALSMGWMGVMLLVLLVRGPHCARHTWFGYEGGLEARKSVIEENQKKLDEEKAGDQPLEGITLRDSTTHEEKSGVQE